MRFEKLFLKSISKISIRKCLGILDKTKSLNFNVSFDITFYSTRHEFTVGIIANVANQLTGISLMFWATSVPDFTNMATRVCLAILDHSPMVACSAQISRLHITFVLSHPWIGNATQISGMTKSSLQREHAEDLATCLRAPLQHVTARLPEPAYVSPPVDSLKTMISLPASMNILQSLRPCAQIKKAEPAHADIVQTAERMTSTAHAMIAMSNPVICTDVQASVCHFAQRIHGLIIYFFTAASSGPDDHPQLLTAANKSQDGVDLIPVRQALFESVNLVILIGYDVTLHKLYIERRIIACRLNRFLYSNVCDSFSFALYTSMEALISPPETHVVILCRDNVFRSANLTLETIARYSLPREIIVLSDSAIDHIKHDQHFDRSEPGNKLAKFDWVDFAWLANANSVDTKEVHNIATFPNVLENIPHTRQPQLIAIPFKYDYNLWYHIP